MDNKEVTQNQQLENLKNMAQQAYIKLINRLNSRSCSNLKI